MFEGISSQLFKNLFFYFFYFNRFFFWYRWFLVAWISSFVVISEVLVHLSSKQCTLYLLHSFLSLTPFQPSPPLSPEVHCITLMPLYPRSLAATCK